MDEGTNEGSGRYAAFLSYSHRDAATARALHRRLESYRIPRRLVGSEGERGPVPARLVPIFRDREEFPAAGDLSEQVRAALAESNALVILCSPAAAASPWVAKEIETFRALHPDRPIIAAILDGEPAEAFPPALCAGGIEPLAADLRPGRDGRRLGFLKLVAGLSGVGLDALVQRDAQRRLRRVTAVTGVALAAVVAMAVLTAVALQARAEAQRQRAEAEGLVEFMLTDLRDRLRGVGRLDVLTAVNERALAYYAHQNLADLSSASLERRARILHVLGEDDVARGDLPHAVAEFQEASRTTATVLSRDRNNQDWIFNDAQSAYWIGAVAEQQGHYPAAAIAYRRYREAAEQLYRIAPRNPKFIAELAYAENNLGSVELKGFARPGVARSHFTWSLAWFTQARKLDPKNLKWVEHIADAHAWLADTWFIDKRFEEARLERLAERRIKERLCTLDPRNKSYAYAAVVTERSLARIAFEEGRYTESLRVLAPARSAMAQLLQLDGRNFLWVIQASRIEIDASRAHAKLNQNRDRARALERAWNLLTGASTRAGKSTEEHRRLREWVASERLTIRNSQAQENHHA